VAPKASPRGGGPPSGGRVAAGAEAAIIYVPQAPASRYGVALSFGRTAPPSAVATRSAGRGTHEAGWTRVGDATTALMDDWAVHPAAGSHLPSEDTAPPSAAAFPSSPFAHPIPQSRRCGRMGFIQRFLNKSRLSTGRFSAVRCTASGNDRMWPRI
jgi:hypothetical protein